MNNLENEIANQDRIDRLEKENSDFKQNLQKIYDILCSPDENKQYNVVIALEYYFPFLYGGPYNFVNRKAIDKIDFKE